MTDEEKFQKTFDKLHASPDVLTEVLKMTAKEQVLYLTPWGPEQHFALIDSDSDQPVFQMGI